MVYVSCDENSNGAGKAVIIKAKPTINRSFPLINLSASIPRHCLMPILFVPRTPSLVLPSFQNSQERPSWPLNRYLSPSKLLYPSQLLYLYYQIKPLHAAKRGLRQSQTPSAHTLLPKTEAALVTLKQAPKTGRAKEDRRLGKTLIGPLGSAGKRVYCSQKKPLPRMWRVSVGSRSSTFLCYVI